MKGTVQAAAIIGLDVFLVDVEALVSSGVNAISIDGLPATSVVETRTRVKQALGSAGYGMPPGRVAVSMSSPSVRKTGTGFDLPVALAILVAGGQLPADALADTLVVGELSLDGRVRGVRGILPVVLAAKAVGKKRVIVPLGNGAEAHVVDGIEVFAVETLRECVDLLVGPEGFTVTDGGLPPGEDTLDIRDIRGNPAMLRALEIAAAGGHNILIVGPPGAGKTMFARRLGGILPPMSLEERLSVGCIASIAGLYPTGQQLGTVRPFRAPHHSVSTAALVGGGPGGRPGEVSLANNGVLLLDELPEFRRETTDALEAVLGEGEVHLPGGGRFPACFHLVGAMAPCPCGYAGHPARACDCSQAQIEAYQKRVRSLESHFQIQARLEPVSAHALRSAPTGETSATVRARVVAARARSPQAPWVVNARLRADEIRHGEDVGLFIAKTATRHAQALNILRVARTIADLAQSEEILVAHAVEAAQISSALYPADAGKGEVADFS